MPVKKLLIWGVVGFVFYFGFGAIKSQAACYCAPVNGAPNPQCRCAATPPASATFPGSRQGISVLCDSQSEADSLFATQSPICGTSSEIVPYCAFKVDRTLPDGIDYSEVTCYGTEFASNPGNVPAETAGLISWSGGVSFNGFSATGVSKLLTCKEGNFCCARSDIQCVTPTDIPTSGSSCTPPNEAATIPAWCPNYGGGPTDPQAEKAETDSRIYFPHVKNTSSITYLLQSMYRPISWTVSEIIHNVVYSQVFEHQGLSDATPVINKKDNNASLIPGKPAPTPIFDFANQPPKGVPGDGRCTVTDVRTNPGDDLLGKKIYANLNYNQVYKYTLLTCEKYTGQGTDSNGSGCCPGSQPEGCTTVEDPLTGNSRTFGCKCGPVYDNQPSKGKVLVFTKSPFLEYLYQNLVAGPAGIYRRFVSQDTAADIKDIPTEANIAVDSQPGLMTVADGSTSKTAKIYFPHLGSVYDYFLKNLQKLLRPQGSVDTFEIVTTDDPAPPGTVSCTAPPLTSCAAVDWNRRIYDVYANAYNLDTNASFSLVKEDWAQKKIDFSGMCPQFVAALWLEESGGSAVGSYDLGCIYNLETKAESQANTHPTNLSAAGLRQYREGILNEQLTCLKSYVTAIGDDFQTFMCQYSGEADTDPSQPYRQCTTFTNNPNFPSNLCDLLGGYIPAGDSAPVPGNVNQPGGLTPSQICLSKPADGSYPLPGNPSRCVVCENKLPVNLEVCRQ
ncbi:MAG: hypothetical protein Q7S31_02785 [bacterium]|nr:hypothetical protein [bacterium]